MTIDSKNAIRKAPAGGPAAARRILGASLLLALAGGLALPGGARAQAADAAVPAPAAPGPEGKLADIVVTAEKRTSTVQATPISITAISGEQLAEQGITNVTAVIDTVPGISMRTSGPGQTELEMRGMSSSGGSSPTVGFYLDETPLTPPAASLNGKVVIDPDLFDLKRVEVLRGPQGTLYGAGSMGGTIKLITNAPDPAKFEGDVDLTLSHTPAGGNNPNGKFMINVPLVDDKVALRLVATDKRIDGWINRDVLNPFPFPTNPGPACAGWPGCTRGDVTAAAPSQVISKVNWEAQQGERASLLVKASDALSVTAMVLHQHTTMGGYNDYDLPPGSSGTEAHYQPFNTPEPFADTFTLYSTTIAYDLGFADLTAATSYWTRDENQTQDAAEALYSLLNYFGSKNSLGQHDNAFMPIGFTEQDLSNQLSQEIRLASSGDGPLQWLGGVFFSKLVSTFHDTNAAASFADFSAGYAAANPQGIVYDSYNPYHVKQYALFGEGSYKLSDAVKATAGLRWFKYSTHADEWQSGIGTFSGNATPTTAAFDTSANGFTPKLNVSYEPTKELTVYGTIAKGFRPGGVNLPIPGGIGCALTTEVYAPDTSWDYEVGEKTRMFDGRLVVNADVYYIKWKSIQQLINQPCGYPLTQNAGDAASYGPELEVTGHITKELTLSVNGAYTHATLRSVDPVLTAAAPNLVAGTPILNVPKFTHSTALSFAVPLDSTYDSVTRLTNSFVGPSTDISYTYTRLPSYDLLGLRTGVVSEKLSGFLFIDNLTNRRAALSTNTTAFSWVIPSLIRVATNQPRTFGVEFNYHF